jgi:hypothetical protein
VVIGVRVYPRLDAVVCCSCSNGSDPLLRGNVVVHCIVCEEISMQKAVEAKGCVQVIAVDFTSFAAGRWEDIRRWPGVIS